MFSGSSSLISYPNLSKYNIANKEDIYPLFEGNYFFKSSQIIKVSNNLSTLDKQNNFDNQNIEYEFINRKVIEKKNKIYFSINNSKYSIIQINVSVKNKIIFLNPDFVKKYRNKCKIIFENKIYDLQNEPEIKYENRELAKIKLVFYEKFLNMIDIFEMNIIKNSIYSFCELLMMV